MFHHRRSSRVRVGWLVFGLAITRASFGQSAQSSAEPASVSTPSAELLFRSGREALQRGDYAAACAALAESDRIEPSPGAKLNRALCEEHRGHLVLAWQLLQASLETLPNDDERALIAQRHAEELRHELSFVTFTLAPNTPKTARITSDGEQLTNAELGSALPFEPGNHQVEISARGYTTRVNALTLSAGVEQHLVLTLGPPVPVARASNAGATLKTSENRWRNIAFGLEGAAATLAVASLATGMVAYEAKNEMRRDCDAQWACSEAGLRAASRGEISSAFSTASFGAALLTGGIGAFLLLAHVGDGSRRAITANGVRFQF